MGNVSLTRGNEQKKKMDIELEAFNYASYV